MSLSWARSHVGDHPGHAVTGRPRQPSSCYSCGDYEPGYLDRPASVADLEEAAYRGLARLARETASAHALTPPETPPTPSPAPQPPETPRRRPTPTLEDLARELHDRSATYLHGPRCALCHPFSNPRRAPSGAAEYHRRRKARRRRRRR